MRAIEYAVSTPVLNFYPKIKEYIFLTRGPMTAPPVLKNIEEKLEN